MTVESPAAGPRPAPTRDPSAQLRDRLAAGLRAGGLGVEPADAAALIRQGHAAARPVADDIVGVLEARAQAASDLDFSLLTGIPSMAAFGQLAGGYAYRRLASARAREPQVARLLTAFIVASALYDHACDREPGLLETMTRGLPADWLENAFAGHRVGDPYAGLAVPTPVAQLGALGGYAAELWRDLAASARTRASRAHLNGLWRRLAATHSAQVASTRPGGRREVRLIWSAPLVVALYVVAATPDAEPGVDVGALLPEAERIGLLLSLVDDLADVADDWRWRSANQYLDALPGTGRTGRREPVPWEALMSDEVLEPYLGRIVELTRTVPEDERELLTAWLLYWIEG
ncbi:hypothetical protein [Rugosimonospora africana]|uniref:Uncharacterized protein n=1 Tax=Rugosimonospora africana TaxID=556532 RepID=A0A8J3QUM6_9ACTN|nr:hypothetical protein [Rugosimonospora africana]GIH15141.1 hypothetical protein Raf01_33130 [Rugosimonospora africana]